MVLVATIGRQLCCSDVIEMSSELVLLHRTCVGCLGIEVSVRLTKHRRLVDRLVALVKNKRGIPQQTTQKLVYSTRSTLVECRDSRVGYSHY